MEDRVDASASASEAAALFATQGSTVPPLNCPLGLAIHNMHDGLIICSSF